MRLYPAFPLAALAAVSAYGCARAEAQTVKAQEGRGSIELTVYAGDFAMVRETRKVELGAGRARVGLQGVSKALDQNSVLFNWPGRKDAKVISSTYDLGTKDSGRLLERFLGREIELVYHGQDGREGERVKGILEVADPGNVVVRSNGKYIVNPNATIEAPADAGIVTIPQLSAEVESPSGGSADLAVSYMTGGLSWNADYTATLATDADRLSLECWATVTNKTGTDFPDAKISFVAGSPNRVLNEARDAGEADSLRYEAKGRVTLRAPTATMNAAFDAPRAMGELYAYPYKSTATIRQDQMNRVRMMGSEGVTVKRVYSVAIPGVYSDYNEFGGNPERRIAATLGINFANAKGSGLGIPLPAGAVRVYEPDATGAVRYVGAASIGDTPKDAKVSLELSEVFDVYARARQVSAERIDKRHTRRTIEVTLSNEKAKPVDLRVVQSLGGPWRIASETEKGQKLNSGIDQWTIRVPAGGVKRLRYSVVFGP